MTLVIIFPLLTILHGILSRAITEPSPLGEHRPRCLMKPTNRNTSEKKNIPPMELYKLARCSIYDNEEHNNMITITT